MWSFARNENYARKDPRSYSYTEWFSLQLGVQDLLYIYMYMCVYEVGDRCSMNDERSTSGINHQHLTRTSTGYFFLQTWEHRIIWSSRWYLPDISFYTLHRIQICLAGRKVHKLSPHTSSSFLIVETEGGVDGFATATCFHNAVSMNENASVGLKTLQFVNWITSSWLFGV